MYTQFRVTPVALAYYNSKVFLILFEIGKLNHSTAMHLAPIGGDSASEDSHPVPFAYQSHAFSLSYFPSLGKSFNGH